MNASQHYIPAGTSATVWNYLQHWLIDPEPLTREQWLETLVEKLRPTFAKFGAVVPTVRVSVGFPSRGAMPSKNQRIGECHYSASDGTPQIFVSPLIGDQTRAADILVHELVHAVLGSEAGHGPSFRRLAVKLGLEGKMTATIASQGLKDRLNDLIAEIGDYPHVELVPGITLKKQSTRLLKVVCPDCGYTLRTTAKWLAVGLPTCCCGTEMELEQTEDDGGDD